MSFASWRGGKKEWKRVEMRQADWLWKLQSSNADSHVFAEDDTARWEATGGPRLSLSTKLWANRLRDMRIGSSCWTSYEVKVCH